MAYPSSHCINYCKGHTTLYISHFRDAPENRNLSAYLDTWESFLEENRFPTFSSHPAHSSSSPPSSPSSTFFTKPTPTLTTTTADSSSSRLTSSGTWRWRIPGTPRSSWPSKEWFCKEERLAHLNLLRGSLYALINRPSDIFLAFYLKLSMLPSNASSSPYCLHYLPDLPYPQPSSTLGV